MRDTPFSSLQTERKAVEMAVNVNKFIGRKVRRQESLCLVQVAKVGTSSGEAEEVIV